MEELEGGLIVAGILRFTSYLLYLEGILRFCTENGHQREL